MIRIRLPFPPTVNHYYKSWRNRVVVSDEGKGYRTAVGLAIKVELGCGRPPLLEGPISVDIRAVYPNNLRRDLDNLLKGTLDAMEHAGLYHNDRQIEDLRITKAGVDKNKTGCLIVEIRELTGARDSEATQWEAVGR